MKRLLVLAFLLSVSLGAAALACAQMPKPETVVAVRVEPARLTLQSGQTTSVAVIAVVQAGFHINSNKPIQDYLIPTRVELLEAPGFVLEKADYPVAELKSFGFAPDEKLSVYEGTVKIPVKLRAQPEATTGNHALRLAFHYQACNDRFCLRPARREAALTVRVQ